MTFEEFAADHELRLGPTSAAGPVTQKSAGPARPGHIQLWNHMRATQELNGRVCAARTGYR